MKLKINGKEFEFNEDLTIKDACKNAGIKVPHFCHHKELLPLGACRICVVELEGARTLIPSCSVKIRDGMDIKTHSRRVVNARRNILELILANHDMNCPTCVRNKNCKLQALASDFSINELKYKGETRFEEIDNSSPSFVRDPQRCILCEKCIRVCRDIQDVHCIDFKYRGFKTQIGVPYNHKINDSNCTNCGQCVLHCPVGALHEKEYIKEVVDAIESGKHVIVQTAPSIRVTLGELFGYAPGTNVQGKMVAALKMLGFSKVFDTSLGADFTIYEEANELVGRIKNGGTLPMFTSCCPAWVKYFEHNYSDDLAHLSSCKSPHMMLGKVIKTYYAEKFDVPADNIVVVSIMPCTSKKFEVYRDEMKGDVDYVLTTRELAKLIRQEGINFNNLTDSSFDNPLGIATGAGHIFGATGGVMEAALRTAYETQTNKKLDRLEFDQIRGTKSIKTGIININGIDVRFAVAHGLANAKKVFADKDKYDFIEVMACPGGCIGGGGGPIPTNKSIINNRIQGIYDADKNSAVRRCHENQVMLKVYDEYLGSPGQGRSHELLHTKYIKRES